MSDAEKLFQERLNRYKTAMECGKPDKVPVALSVGEWGIKYSNYTYEEIYYEIDKGVKMACDVLPDLDFDIFGGGPTMWWPPMFDAMGSKLYKFPGIGLDENTTFQYVEAEYMKPEEYDEFIADPTGWIVTKYLPRISAEFENPGSYRATVALIKSAAAYTMFGNMMAEAWGKWTRERGLVTTGTGFTKAPFDTLGDTLRGMRGILLDIRRCPDKVLAACDALVPHNIAYAMIGAGGDTTFPCMAPLHRGAYPFLSVEHWEKFYWPSLKAVIEGLWAQGKRTYFFAEGNWTPYLEKIAELPEKSIIFVVDTTDPKKAKEILGGKFCLWGGIPNTLLTYGTPEQVKDCVKRTIDELGADGGYVLAPGGVVMGDAKRENLIAMVEAGREYGVY